MNPLRKINVIRYVMPLREGGSLPAIAEGDDEVLYVLKFKGAGQGPKALIAELIGGEIARILGLRMPEIVLANLDPAFGRTEPDAEIQDLLKASVGCNLAVTYLSGAITFDPAVNVVDPLHASQIVWLDNLLLNVDRTCRNTNMLMWHKQLWLIDHGASLYFHHSWQNIEQKAQQPFEKIKDHVLLARASEIETVGKEFRQLLTPDIIRSIVSLIPDEWLVANGHFESIEKHRQAYIDFLDTRIAYSTHFTKDIAHAGETLV
jgi:hypothetical protein